jgi:hypothetical protein
MIAIPKWAKITDYRTMTDEKKRLAVLGAKKYQLEWMNEEINEFYEAIHLNDKTEILDEAMGLIRTAQHFSGSRRVISKWLKVRSDVEKVFSSKQIFLKTFRKWKARKLKKGQAKDVVAEDLMKFAKLFRK